MQIVNDTTFGSDVTKESDTKLVVVDFFAEWCPPCRKLTPIVEELSAELSADKAKIVKVDVDQAEKTTEAHGIRSIPTLLFFKGGKVVDRVAGLVSKDFLKSKINSLIGG